MARKYDPICSFPDCGKPHWSKGYCGTHYNQVWRGVDLTPRFNDRRPAGAALQRDELGRKECSKCAYWLPEGEFTKDAGRRDGLALRCRACQRSSRTPRREAIRAAEIERKYGITLAESERMLAEQGHACAICERPDPRGRGWHIDHDHETGAVRGILCGTCNSGLGMLGDSIDILMAAVAYLMSSRPVVSA